MMTPRVEVHYLIQELRKHPEGNIVEVGCNSGSTSLIFSRNKQPDQELYLYDSFQGFPDTGELAATKEILIDNFVLHNEPIPHIFKGFFSETIPNDLPREIAFAFVDCDLYSSMMETLPHIYARLKGSAYVHDYFHRRFGPGVKKALTELEIPYTLEGGMAKICRS